MERVYRTSRDCSVCGDELPVRATYEVDPETGAILIMQVAYSPTCPVCDASQEAGGAEFMKGLQAEIHEQRRQDVAAAAEFQRDQRLGVVS